MSGRKLIKRRGANRGEHADGRMPPVETGHDARPWERGEDGVRDAADRGSGDMNHGANAPDGISGSWG